MVMNKAGRGDKGSPWIDRWGMCAAAMGGRIGDDLARVGCGSQSDIPLYGRSYAQSSSQGGQQDTGFSVRATYDKLTWP